MQVRTSADDDVVEVKLSGRLDLDGSQKVGDEFARATSVRKLRIIVDLSEVDFITSVGIRLLLASARAQMKLGGKLLLAAPQPAVQRVLETSAIDQLIGVVPDLVSARRIFRQ
jgi:anti-sigma B factor antagonist